MKNKPFSQSTGLNWIQKSLIIILGLSIIVIAVGIFLYNDIINTKEMNFEETNRVIINQTPIVKVENIELYHGDEAYHIVYGVNENEEKLVIFYPLEGKEKNITTIKQSEMFPEERLYNQWLSSCVNCELINISPAIKEDTILWEITYYDENDYYVLHYFSIKDGSSYEKFRFKELFN